MEEKDMETLKAIANRHSVRRFTSQAVEREKLEQILLAGKQAPTGINRQNLCFVAIQNPEILKLINSDILKDGGNYYNAPAIILILEKSPEGLTIQNASAAEENMLLAATDLGLGSVWIHSAIPTLNEPANLQKLKEAFKFGFDFKVVESIALGYADGEPVSKEKTEPTYIF